MSDNYQDKLHLHFILQRRQLKCYVIAVWASNFLAYFQRSFDQLWNRCHIELLHFEAFLRNTKLFMTFGSSHYIRIVVFFRWLFLYLALQYNGEREQLSCWLQKKNSKRLNFILLGRALVQNDNGTTLIMIRSWGSLFQSIQSIQYFSALSDAISEELRGQWRKMVGSVGVQMSHLDCEPTYMQMRWTKSY